MGWLVLNGITGPSLGIACYQQALLEQPSAVVLSIVALTPILALPMQWVTEGKRPSGRTWLGACVGVLGVILLRWA
jgi:drug/metabolite transporter (DMT)-like permease